MDELTIKKMQEDKLVSEAQIRETRPNVRFRETIVVDTTTSEKHTLQPDNPPEHNLEDYGPDDPDDYEIIKPSEKPYTVILFDPGSAFAGNSAVQATSLLNAGDSNNEGLR